jgi:hypothetical protein
MEIVRTVGGVSRKQWLLVLAIGAIAFAAYVAFTGGEAEAATVIWKNGKLYQWFNGCWWQYYPAAQQWFGCVPTPYGY